MNLLAKRMKEYSIPEPSFQPFGDDCLIWRLPDRAEDKKTKGGIVMPDAWTGKEGETLTREDKRPNIKGVLLAWGDGAHTALEKGGICIGDIVLWSRFAGWEFDDFKPGEEKEDTGAKLLVLNFKNILGSDDLKGRLASGEMKTVKIEGRYYTVDRAFQLPEKDTSTPKLLARMEKLEQMVEMGTTAEAAVARERLRETKAKLRNGRARS